MTSSALLRAILAGAATGSRSMSAIAACARSGPPSTNRLDRALHRPAGRLLDARGRRRARRRQAAAGARTHAARPAAGPPGAGATSAVVLADRHREPAVPAALAGLAAAAATSVGGVRVRAGLARRFGGDRPGALIEDAVALGLAGTAVRLS